MIETYAGEDEREFRWVKSAERSVRILQVLATSPHMLSLPELQERTGYPRSSLYALVRTLHELEWVEPDSTNTRFGVGPRALLSGTSYLDRDPAVPHARGILEDLRVKLRHTVHFARRIGGDVVYLETREPIAPMRKIHRVGRALPAYLTALGQALLAELTDDEVNHVLPPELTAATDHTITDRTALHAELDKVRSRGWAFEREQGMPGTACVAASVGYRIPATDAISCSMPADVPTSEIEEVAAVLVAKSQELTETLRREGIR